MLQRVSTEPAIKVKVPFSYLEETLASLRDVIASKVNGREEQQNLIFKFQRNESGRVTADLMATAGYTVCRLATAIDVDVTEYVANGVAIPEYLQVRNKEITTAMSGFKSLFITVPTDAEFLFHPSSTYMKVYEQSADFDPQEDETDLYSNESTFKMATNPLTKTTLAELEKANFENNGSPVDVADIMLILDMLSPQIADEKTIGANSIVFEENYIYTRPTSHVTAIPNNMAAKYGDLFRGYKLDINTISLLKAVLKNRSSFLMRKDESLASKDTIIIIVEAEGLYLRFVVPAYNNRFNLQPYLERKTDGNFTFTINKLYLYDILKRAGLGKPITIEYTHTDEKIELAITTETFRQVLPVLAVENQGTTRFTTRSDFFINMTCAYMTSDTFLAAFPSEVTIDIFKTEGNKLDIMVYDATQVWTSKVINVRAN